MSEISAQKKYAINKKTIWGHFITIILEIWYLIHSLIDHIIDRIFAAIYESSRVYIPSTSDNILLDSATGLADKIRKRQLKIERVVSTYIERIKCVNGVLNAVVDEQFAEALKQAKQLDKDIEEGNITEKDFEQKPFLGVPFTTKETSACKGLSNSFGLVSRKGERAREDADVVAFMKSAGGILLGVTNVPQLNLWQETTNPVFGTTNNPYNTTRTVGGSSGGETSIIAACGSPIGIGTDIGGSIRLPCFMCGLFGHKISTGITSTKGLTFRTGKEGDRTMVTTGPIARYACDLIPMVKVLAGANVNKLSLDERVDIKNIKVYYMDEKRYVLCSVLRPEMKEITRKVVNYFRDVLPNQPEKVEFEGIQYGGKLWRYWMKQEPDANFKLDIANRERQIDTWTEIMKYIARRSEYNLAVIYNLIDELLPAVNAKWAENLTKVLREQIIETLGKDGVLLYPSAPWPASYHGTAYLRPYNFNYFAVWNALKLPVTQVPLGLNSDGLPLGIQVVAGPYQDHLSIAIAKELEKGFGGYVPPFKIDK